MNTTMGEISTAPRFGRTRRIRPKIGSVTRYRKLPIRKTKRLRVLTILNAQSQEKITFVIKISI